MTTEAPEQAVQAVVTPQPGTMVWCPDGDGNRILDVDDPWPMHCPQCSQEMVVEKPGSYTIPTEDIRLPRLGDTVLVRISLTQWRPAMVIGIGADEASGKPDGRLHVHVFKDPLDPNPPALSQDVGWTRYGDRIGGWLHRGPAGKKPETFAHPIEG